MRDEYKVLIGRPEDKRPLGRSKHRREEGPNINTYSKKVGWKSADWIHLAQDRAQWRALEYIAMNLWLS
jgi:hypothetical protein